MSLILLTIVLRLRSLFRSTKPSWTLLPIQDLTLLLLYFTPPKVKRFWNISPHKLNQVLLDFVRGTLTKPDIIEEILLPIEDTEVIKFEAVGENFNLLG